MNLPFPAAASFVLGKEHVVHKAETNPPEYSQLYEAYAHCLVHNMHLIQGTFLLPFFIFTWKSSEKEICSPSVTLKQKNPLGVLVQTSKDYMLSVLLHVWKRVP